MEFQVDIAQVEFLSDAIFIRIKDGKTDLTH